MMDRRLRAMLPLFAAVFIDLFSFGLMYPVIVSLFHLPAIERLYPVAVRSLYLSLAFSLFPLGMFVGASLLGDLSDAFGRQRTLLVCMTGLALAYGLMLVGVQTRDLLWFLAGRLLSGLMAGSSPIAQAAMMDQSIEEERGSNMSHVVLVNCLALVSGPAMGGLLGHVDFRAPLLFAMCLCVIAFVWIHTGMHEGSRARKKLAIGWKRPFEVFVHASRHPVIRGLATSFFLFQFGFGIYYVYIMVFMTRTYRLTSAELGLFSAVMGLGFVLGSTLGYAWTLRWLKRNDRVAQLGLILCGLLIIVAALPIGQITEWPLALAVTFANLPAFVGLLTLISSAADADEQGWALGIGASMTALAFLAAGLLAVALHLVSLPWLIGIGGLIVVVAFLPLRAASSAAGRMAPAPTVAVDVS